MLNHYLSQKFKLIGNDEFNYLIYILTVNLDVSGIYGANLEGEFFGQT
jgi:hypothetical protein